MKERSKSKPIKKIGKQLNKKMHLFIKAMEKKRIKRVRWRERK